MTTSPRYAVVGPYAAAWLAQQLRRGAPTTSASARAHALMLRRAGHEALAAEIEFSWAQLTDAAADHRARHDAASVATSDDGSSEAEIEEVEASSVPAVRDVSASRAGVLLGVSTRTVTGWASAGALPGRRVGRAWLVDLDAVNALAAERSKAS